MVTGLAWRGHVCQQVFEEAARDLGRALEAWSRSRRGDRRGQHVGYPRRKKKGRSAPSFRLRNKYAKNGRAAIRVGDEGPRSITMPGVGTIRVCNDTRPLRRMLAAGRARVLFAAMGQRAGRWWVSLSVEAADLHRAHQHRPRSDGDHGGWVGLDLGLRAFVVAATSDGTETARVEAARLVERLIPGEIKQRRLARAVSRKSPGSKKRREAVARLSRHRYHLTCVRRHFLHQISNQLVNTHDRLVVENLHVAGMLRNRRLARAIARLAWAEFARQLAYKQAWRGGELAVADRWFASSKTCSRCGNLHVGLDLRQRIYRCDVCRLVIDRDRNAAANLAAWAERHFSTAQPRDPQAGGPVINAHRQEGSGPRRCVDSTGLDDMGTSDQAARPG